jgi:hypothetical protein
LDPKAGHSVTPPDAFTRWAQSNAIPQEYWHLCRQAWEAGVRHRHLNAPFTIADATGWSETDAIATTGCKATVSSRLDT